MCRGRCGGGGASGSGRGHSPAPGNAGGSAGAAAPVVAGGGVGQVRTGAGNIWKSGSGTSMSNGDCSESDGGMGCAPGRGASDRRCGGAAA